MHKEVSDGTQEVIFELLRIRLLVYFLLMLACAAVPH